MRFHCDRQWGLKNDSRDQEFSMPLNVLVVDDSSVMRSMIIKTLRLCGIRFGEIHEAANGQEGLAILTHKWIDLALVDLNMPVMNGEEMIERARARPETAQMPIIVVSTEGSETRIARLREQGSGFIHKPFNPEIVRDMIIQMTGVTDDTSMGEAFAPGDSSDF
jgi:two-component system, chemotaxis family, chemotaxis protein CheY